MLHPQLCHGSCLTTVFYVSVLLAGTILRGQGKTAPSKKSLPPVVP